MGVTKQAAQKRFVPKPGEWESLWTQVFEARPYSRFTDRAKRVVEAAHAEARDHQHDYVGTEHLALGLLHEPTAVAARAIEALGVPQQTAREALEGALLPATGAAPDGVEIPLTAKSRKSLVLALREALRMGHNYIGTEHILLGLLAEGEGIGGTTLAGLGVTSERTEQWITAELERIMAGKRARG
jgi:ATP-dependent Clp protease ATP-binding subunit ClpA